MGKERTGSHSVHTASAGVCFILFPAYSPYVRIAGIRVGEYEPGKPEGGFLYPAFRNRTADMEYINVFHEELFKYIINEQS